MFSEAFFYANERTAKGMVDHFDNTLIGLSFLGGCFPVALLLMPMIGKRLLRIGVPIFAVGIAILIYSRGSIAGHSFVGVDGIDPGLVIQFCAFSLAGICLVIACLKEISKGVNHDSVFLLLWFFGILVFVFYLNWTINARSFILLVPVAGILLSRRLEEWVGDRGDYKVKISYALLGIAALIAVATTHADFIWAGTARVAAKEITTKYNKLGNVWFQGHWGFQFYMEKLGAKPVNFRGDDIQPGDFVIIPLNNTNLEQLNHQFNLVEVLDFSSDSFFVTMNLEHNAGFYASVWGAMPYVVEKNSIERYLIYRKSE